MERGFGQLADGIVAGADCSDDERHGLRAAAPPKKAPDGDPFYG
jgi:hypothetical protein